MNQLNRKARRIWTAWMAAVVVGLATHGCATTPPHTPDTRSPIPGQSAGGGPEPSPTPAPPPTSPMPGTQVGTTASGGRIITTAPQPALVDTLPSADALEVLGTIPEPLPPGERVPPPRRPAQSGGLVPDATEQDAQEGDGDVPVPAPTRVLGDRPGASPDTASGSAAAVAPAQTPATRPATPASSQTPTSSAPPTAANSDTCWRVQLAAVPEPERANSLRAAGESQLDVPVVIENDGKLRKVRTKDCLGALAAEQLRRKAEAVGFTGAFRFRRK